MSADDPLKGVDAATAEVLRNLAAKVTAQATVTPLPVSRPAAARERPDTRLRMLKGAGAPHREATTLLGLGARPLQRTEAIDIVDMFLAEVERGARQNICVLSSPVHGTGKTIAALHFLNTATPHEGPGEQRLFVHAAELVEMSRIEHEEDRVRLKRVKLLVIDDLSKEYGDQKGYWLAFVQWLINARQSAEGLTLITTNANIESFRQRYGELVYDRLREAAAWCDLATDTSMRGKD